MGGFLTIRVEPLSDAFSSILTLDSKEEGGSSRMGKTLKIDVGRSAKVKLPDFLLDEGEVDATSDTEPTDQILERQGAQIVTQQELQQSSLVPADETDHHRMQELMTALHNERETTRALQELYQFVESEFSKYITTAPDAELKEIESRHGVSSGDDNPNAKRSAIQTKFNNASVAEKVDLFMSAKTALEESTKREAASNFTATQSNLDNDAKYTGDTYRGADSSTDNNDVAETRDEEQVVESDSSESSSAPETSSAGLAVGDQKGQDTDESHIETQEKADEAIEDEELSAESNWPERDQPGGYQGHHQGGDSTNQSDLDDRAVIMEDQGEEEDDNFKTKVNKLKVAQLSEVESSFDELDGEGNSKARKDALKEAYDNADEDKKQELSNAVDSALNGGE
jgi:hypothetical protein